MCYNTEVMLKRYILHLQKYQDFWVSLKITPKTITIQILSLTPEMLSH